MAKRKLTIAKLEDVAEAERENYVQQKDGSFRLDLEGIEKIDEDLSKIDEFRSNNRTMKQQLDSWVALGMTPDQARERIKKAAEDEKAQDRAKGDVESLEKKWKKEHDDAIAAKDLEINSLKGKLHGHEVTGVARTAALAAGVRAKDVDDLLERPSISKRLKRREDGNGIVILDEDGDPTHKSPQQFFESLKTSHAVYFEAVNPGGAGTKTGDSKTVVTGDKKTVSAGESAAMSANLEAIASGKVTVVAAEG